MNRHTTTAPSRSSSTVPRWRPQHIAASLSGTIAALYGLLFAGVLPLERATTGELGILGVAGAVHAVIAGLLWWRSSRLLWAAAATLQVLLGGMYLAIAPDRDPAFEIWGVTIRVVSLVLLVALIRLLLSDRRERTAART